MKIDSSFVKDNFDFLKIIEHTSRDLVQANVSEFYLLRRHELFELQTVYDLYNPGRVVLERATAVTNVKQRQQNWLWKKYPNWSTNVLLQVHIFCVVREQPGGVDGKERLKRALQSFKILPQTNDRQQMTEEERYVDYGFEHRVSFVKGTLYGVSTLSLRTIFL